ncbi:MAG: deacylase [Desulfovibrio sp.]|nr:deacylase [Desulfovibrio sp.]
MRSGILATCPNTSGPRQASLALDFQELSGARIFKRAVFIFCVLLLPHLAQAAPLDFTVLRLGQGAPVALVVGGIQGDEPGGFSAASLLATRYEIQEGSLWVVPNLNFPSIIRRSRGLHGDMNRKFAALAETDPEFGTVRRIQDLIVRPEVGLVLNLHDGSGYYRPQEIDRLKNPRRWGQSIIIDQEHMADSALGNLGDMARSAAGVVNQHLVEPEHAIHIRNTNTALGDREMEKSLSWYAVRNGKPAFGLEASKELSVARRAYYHLSMVEDFLRQAGIKFSRDFELSPAGVEKALAEDLGISFAGNRVFLPLDNARPTINFLPLPPDGAVKAIPSKPIMAVLPCKDNPGRLCVHYGNRTIALIKPEWREMTDELDALWALVDGEKKLAPFGQVLDVNRSVTILPREGFRVNAIGYGGSKQDEAGKNLKKKDFQARHSVDREGNLFRVEVYKGDKFAGMFLLRFGGRPALTANAIQPDSKGPESELGY